MLTATVQAFKVQSCEQSEPRASTLHHAVGQLAGGPEVHCAKRRHQQQRHHSLTVASEQEASIELAASRQRERDSSELLSDRGEALESSYAQLVEARQVRPSA